jgi:acetyl-CoA synthetase
VTVKEGITSNRELAEELKKHVRKVIGPVATPDEVRFAAALPKTRSGKIMRRLLKQIAAGELIKGDTTTLEDINVIAQLAAGGED